MRRLESAIDLALVTAMMMAACTPAEGSGTPDGFTGGAQTLAVSTPTEQEQVLGSEFIQLQERIAQSEDFTLMGDGTFEMKIGESIITVSGLKIDPATGECMYYGTPEPVACQPDLIVIGADKSLTITLATGETITTKDGVTWEPVEVIGTPEIDPLEWQSFGPNAEIIATGADLTLWDGTPEEQRFTISPENAAKLHEGLFTFAAMINWHGNEAIREQYGNFMQYEQYLKTHPEQVDWTIVESNYYAGNPNSRNQGKFVEVSEKVDLSQFAVAFEDTDDNPEGEGWIHVGGGVIFKMQIIQVEDGENILRFTFSNKLQYSDDQGHLGLNPVNLSKENVTTLRQAMNLLISRGGRMATKDNLNLVGMNDDQLVINFGFDSIDKAYYILMANGTEYIEAVGE